MNAAVLDRLIAKVHRHFYDRPTRLRLDTKTNGPFLQKKLLKRRFERLYVIQVCHLHFCDSKVLWVWLKTMKDNSAYDAMYKI